MPLKSTHLSISNRDFLFMTHPNISVAQKKYVPNQSTQIGDFGEKIILQNDIKIYADMGCEVHCIGRNNMTQNGQSFNTTDNLIVSKSFDIGCSVKAEKNNSCDRKHLQSFISFTHGLKSLVHEMNHGGKLYPVLERNGVKTDFNINHMDCEILNIYHDTLKESDGTAIESITWASKSYQEKQGYRSQIDLAWLSYFSSKNVIGRVQLQELTNILHKNTYFLSLGFYFLERRSHVFINEQKHNLKGYVDYIRNINSDGTEYFFSSDDYVKDNDFYYALIEDIGSSQVERHHHGKKPVLCLPFFQVRHDKGDKIQICHMLHNMHSYAKKRLIKKKMISKTYNEYVAYKKKHNPSFGKFQSFFLQFKPSHGSIMDSAGAFYIKLMGKWKRIPLDAYGKQKGNPEQFSMLAVVHNNLFKRTREWLASNAGQEFIQSHS